MINDGTECDASWRGFRLEAFLGGEAYLGFLKLNNGKKGNWGS